MTTPSSSVALHLRIGGMHCASCELLLERKFRALPGVTSVNVNHRKGTATLTCEPGSEPSGEALERIVMDAGYKLLTISSKNEQEHARPHHADAPLLSQQHLLEIGGALVIILAVWKILQTFDLVSLAPSTSGALTYGGVLLIGLVAGMSSCLAVTGGLLLAMAAKYHETHLSATPWQKLRPLLHFNAGRLVSYFFLGGLVGLLGNSITLSTQVTGYMNIMIALVMLYLALTILRIIPKGAFPIRPPKALSHWIADLSENDHPLAPIGLGALTFFLPCGFTQSLQLVALASGSFLGGALIMFTFAVGTLPALLGISAISSHAKGSFSRFFLTFAGTLVLILSLFNLRSGLALAGIDLPLPTFSTSSTTAPPRIAAQDPTEDTSAPVADATVQEIAMAVTPYSYEPSELTIRAGVPVRWIVDGTNASGCTRGLVIPSLGVQKILYAGQNVIEFTAPNPGRLNFSCSMGMVRGSFNVI